MTSCYATTPFRLTIIIITQTFAFHCNAAVSLNVFKNDGLKVAIIGKQRKVELNPGVYKFELMWYVYLCMEVHVP